MHSSVAIGLVISRNSQQQQTNLENLSKQMFETVVKKIVDGQVESGAVEAEERDVYVYGYQMLIEFCINIITSILIAFVFRAFDIVIIFTVAFLLIRGYVGGYHAKTSAGCFCWSACMLILSVIAVKAVSNLEFINYFFLLEAAMLPCIFHGSPIPDANKPITGNESMHFKKKVKQIYLLELFTEVILLFLGMKVSALSILAVHVVLFVMVLWDVFCRRQCKRI